MTTAESAPLAGLTEADFDAHLARLPDLPAWLVDLKRDAFRRFQTLPLPARREESWRFADTKRLQLDGFHQESTRGDFDTGELFTLSNHIKEYAGKTVFADGWQANHFEVSDELRQKGVIWEGLPMALERYGDRLQEYFLAETPDLGGQKLLALHTAFVRSGAVLFVPDGVEIDLPFLAYHWTVQEKAAIFPHTLIVAGKHSKLTFVDLYGHQNPEGQNLIVGSTSIFAGAGSQVRYVSLQDWNRQSSAFHINSVSADRDADLRTTNVHVGSAHCRSEQDNRITGQGANIETTSLTVANGDQEIDQRTLQTHLAGHARSELLYKNALLDDARTIFSGLIRVEEGAQQTDAYQTNRNLLLDATADAVSLPGLEIEANDVKCSHGATTGRLSEDEVFYLQARGIPLRKAQELLVFGFFEEIIEKLERDDLQNWVRQLVQDKFSEHRS